MRSSTVSTTPAGRCSMARRGTFVVGARGSALSRAQTQGALDALARAFPGTRYRLVAVETPGDRDLTTPIERSAPDFFTRDLDDAVRAGRIDFAVHSAKDLPETIAPDLDWFWLPGGEDPRDCWVTRAGLPTRRSAAPRIGVSSERRRAYAAACFPRGKLLPIRGAIDARLEQLRAGAFDAVLMAMAGLKRLHPEWFDGSSAGDAPCITPIALDALTPPEAQGRLAVVFRAGDTRLMTLRQRFVKAVRFVSAGVGDAGLCTVAGARDLAQADVVLYDDLQGAHAGAGTWIPVGKRCGAHSMRQPEITRLICDEARKGKRVVRLKGGDAGLFGRLAEETDALAALKIPFLVRPGVSALTAATTGTGLLLTRRGESAGFSVYTPRRADGAQATGTPPRQLVIFMAAKVAEEEARTLMAAGWAPETPCALVLDAGGPGEEVRTATLATLRGVGDETRPGLLLVGPAATHRWPRDGELGGRRVLVTCSEALQEKAALAVEDRGGRPIRWPLIRLVPRLSCAPVSSYDALVLTSPSAVRLFFEVYAGCDRRNLPAIYTCGAGTDGELRRFGVASDLMPPRDFSAAGLIAEIARHDLAGKRVLRLRSAKAGAAVARALRRAGAKVDDVVLYDNEPVAHAQPLPPFDDVFFASASAVEVFLAQHGAARLRGKGLHVMGEPTRAALPPALAARARIQHFI